MEICDFTLEFDHHVPMRFQVVAEAAEDCVEVRLDVLNSSEDVPFVDRLGQVILTQKIDRLRISHWSMEGQGAAFVACLLVDAGGQLAHETADCYGKHGKQWFKIVECMQIKGHVLQVDLIKGIARCAIASLAGG
jgi:hypothetical protein